MDPRQRRSRDRLYAAVLDLATGKPVTDLTVAEVAAAAGVHRSTLYEHAGGPVELLEQALTAELDELRAHLSDDADSEVARAVSDVTRSVLEHVMRHIEVYRRGLGEGSGAASLHAMLATHFRASAVLLLQAERVCIDVPVPGVSASAVVDAATRFLADGVVGLIEGWVHQDRPRIETFMGVFAALLPPWWPRVAE